MGLLGAIKGAFGAKGRPQAAPNNQGMFQRVAQAAGGLGPSPEMMQKPQMMPAPDPSQMQQMMGQVGAGGPQPAMMPQQMPPQPPPQMGPPQGMPPQAMNGMRGAMQAARPGMQLPMRPQGQVGRGGIAPRFIR